MGEGVHLGIAFSHYDRNIERNLFKNPFSLKKAAICMEASSSSIDSDCSNHDPKGYGGATMGARGQIFYMGIYGGIFLKTFF